MDRAIKPLLNRPSFRYVPELDGLRAIAVLTVIVFHGNPNYLWGGFLGVDIFFVLSGFLITTILLEEYDSYGSIKLRSFYARRLIRLAPALILLLVVYVAASLAFADPLAFRSSLFEAFMSLFYLVNWARAFDLYPSQNFLGHMWSLSIEEQFYILWPTALLFLLRKNSGRFTITLVSAGVVMLSMLIKLYLIDSGASVNRLYNGLDTRADSLMIGCTLALALTCKFANQSPGTNPAKKATALIAIAAACVLTILFIKANYLAMYMYYGGFLIAEIITAFIIFDIVTNEKSLIKIPLGNRVLIGIGKISYGLYLWHYPVFVFLRERELNPEVILPFGTALTFCAALISYHVIEKPAQAFRGKFSRQHNLPLTAG